MHHYCFYFRMIVCGAGYQTQFDIPFVISCSLDTVQIWTTSPHFTARWSFSNSKALMYHCENSSFCRKMISLFAQIITDNKWSLASRSDGLHTGNLYKESVSSYWINSSSEGGLCHSHNLNSLHAWKCKCTLASQLACKKTKKNKTC